MGGKYVVPRLSHLAIAPYESGATGSPEDGVYLRLMSRTHQGVWKELPCNIGPITRITYVHSVYISDGYTPSRGRPKGLDLGNRKTLDGFSTRTDRGMYEGLGLSFQIAGGSGSSGW